ncbi:MAG: dTDP-glucose 4,6-dehydratase [Pseudomonadota bacterium]
MKVLVTGGCGFIGSAVVRLLTTDAGYAVCNLDKLTYSGDPSTVETVVSNPRYRFVQGDIGDAASLAALLAQFQPDAVMHVAAETHVDRSITGPRVFIETNVVGTYTLLEQCHRYWQSLSGAQRAQFRFVHVSTDEVFGALGESGEFSEHSRYQPNSPYSASKAASDHLVRAWHSTYGFPALVTNCSNNYGPYQYPEKLIPLMVQNALSGQPLPVYGSGLQIRDWLHVEDHAAALHAVLCRGRVGESYNIGGSAERRNIDVVQAVCAALDAKAPRPSGSYEALITHVTDRLGHDFRYAVCTDKIAVELGWTPSRSFESGLSDTIDWYLGNQRWLEHIAGKREQGAGTG